MINCESCKYASKFTNGLILCDFLKTKICVTANHTCKYGKPEEKMKNLINEQPEQDIEHCATCIHAADSEDMCILRECKYAIAELKDCYESKQEKRKRGKWIRQDNKWKTLYGWYQCSECGAFCGGKTNFCSECGADMREDMAADVPTIPQPEIIRCRECVYKPCKIMPYSSDNDFCSYAARREVSE